MPGNDVVFWRMSIDVVDLRNFYSEPLGVEIAQIDHIDGHAPEYHVVAGHGPPARARNIEVNLAVIAQRCLTWVSSGGGLRPGRIPAPKTKKDANAHANPPVSVPQG